MLSGRAFVIGCAATSAALLVAGRLAPLPLWLLASEVLATILRLFLFGSFKYQIHKNALTYGMLLVVLATFAGFERPMEDRDPACGMVGVGPASISFLHGLDDVIHADTMLFILGLTLFVSVIAQTRVLEGITFFLLGAIMGIFCRRLSPSPASSLSLREFSTACP